MAYQKIEPDIRLKPYIESIWLQEDLADARFFNFQPTNILPVPKIDFIFHYLDPFVEVCDDKIVERPKSFICGHRTKPVKVAATGKTGIIIVSMYPWSASAFISGPVSDFTDESIDLHSVYGSKLMYELEEKIFEADNNSGRIKIIEQFLTEIISKKKKEELVRHAAYAMNSRYGSFPIRKLADEYNISRRHIDRLFKEMTGLAPKELSGIIRYQKALNMYKSGLTISEVIYRLGYYDQAHFIKEIKRYTGKSPTEISRKSPLKKLNKYFNTENLSHFYNTIYL